MNELINKIKEGTKIYIKGKEYIIYSKIWYSILEDITVSYIKCELSENKVLVVIPDDNMIYIGEVIPQLNYKKISDNEISYNDRVFNKVGDGHQFITKIEFKGNTEVEGSCIFEDYENGDKIISLGILTDKNDEKADVYAEIINIYDIKI